MHCVNLNQINWTIRDQPLVPEAVFISSAEVPQVCNSLLTRTEIPELRGLRFSRGLLLLGKSEDLPWTPNAQYFGRDSESARVYLPTLLASEISAALLEAAIFSAYPKYAGDAVALLPDDRLIVPISVQRRMDRQSTQALLADCP